jgi:hypothetical protein
MTQAELEPWTRPRPQRPLDQAEIVVSLPLVVIYAWGMVPLAFVLRLDWEEQKWALGVFQEIPAQVR